MHYFISYIPISFKCIQDLSVEKITMRGHEDKIGLFLCFLTEEDISKGKGRRNNDKMKFNVLQYRKSIKKPTDLGEYLQQVR